MAHFNNKIYFLFSAGIISLFLFVSAFLDKYGRDSRITGFGYFFNDPRLNKILVDYPEQAYNLWKKKGVKGRIVISLSRRLNFIEPAELSSVPLMSFPLKVFNISEAVEDNLRAENFLLVSMETGRAREIIHVVPERDFSEKLEAARKKEGVVIAEEGINVPFFGSPRIITTLPFLKPTDEPVLIFINASFFRDYEPEELMRELLQKGLKTDLVILCRSFDDMDVTDKEREKLKIFETLLGRFSSFLS